MIHEGHPYQHGTRRVIVLAIDAGRARVQVIDHSLPSKLGRIFNTATAYLSPLPLKYLGGAVPGDAR